MKRCIVAEFEAEETCVVVCEGAIHASETSFKTHEDGLPEAPPSGSSVRHSHPTLLMQWQSRGDCCGKAGTKSFPVYFLLLIFPARLFSLFSCPISFLTFFFFASVYFPSLSCAFAFFFTLYFSFRKVGRGGSI